MTNLARIILIGGIRLYRYFLSPLKQVLGLGPSCRFHPTCSCYALEAVQLHGPARGSFLTIKRLSRCHPWGAHGFDPVPVATARGR